VRVVRDCNARWLPSRHRSALAKLIAFVLFTSSAKAPASRDTVYAIDRDQSALEQFSTSVWLMLTLIVDIAVLLPLRPWLAAIVAVLAAPWLVQIPMYVCGTIVTLPGSANQSVNSAATILAIAILSAIVATRPGPARYVSWLFFGLLALNAVAWVIVRLLRARIGALEARCGV
jgi:hypothetical protein